MLESGLSGSVRGVLSNGHPYRDPGSLPDSRTAAKAFAFTATNSIHSITSSARASSESGIVKPNDLAVFMLMISSNFVGSSTGRSDGLASFKILSTWIAVRACRPTFDYPQFFTRLQQQIQY
jgi:hypothetical protein